MMRATHIDYKHPKHLRVITGEKYPAWNISLGFHVVDAVCVAPSASCYDRLNKKGLPSLKGKTV